MSQETTHSSSHVRIQETTCHEAHLLPTKCESAKGEAYKAYEKVLAKDRDNV
jgi:hypothetical protein